jgi:hypothetical protein
MDKMEKISGVCATERDKLARWYGRLNERERLDVHKLQADLWRQRRAELAPLGDSGSSYAALILALAKRQATLSAAERKVSMTPDQAEQVGQMHLDAIQGRHKGKGEGKIARLIRIRWYHEIERLRAKGLSWRELSDYIAKHHKQRVSHTHLKATYERVAANREQVGGPDE